MPSRAICGCAERTAEASKRTAAFVAALASWQGWNWLLVGLALMVGRSCGCELGAGFNDDDFGDARVGGKANSKERNVQTPFNSHVFQASIFRHHCV